MSDPTEDEEKDFVMHGVAAIFEKGWRRGYSAGKKDGYFEGKYMVPVAVFIIMGMIASIGGAVLYGVAARQGWANIIGVCLNGQ